ncbi:FAD-dependent oxidoreductase [Chitinophaga arvensicola]|uniref:Flavin-dependent monooxygenase n=1 Tax=Chitinophaga arvensicola TaxID=29529 RepID=A0A1I0S6L4_9BACT|nr:NAD(P)/FAD-dependent oxidoreductase [Chitinophaga arvensicola]SEW51056.1 2-polyprenyl-6-methoxyphenol hydroxylase [Chitinophaga arvensicola]
MHLLNNKKIAIVGGGPGGLTLARLLQISGADVHVYERDLNKDVRVQGATLDLHDDSGLKALRKAGLMEAFQANYRPGADKLRIMDKHAHIVMDEDERENEPESGEYFRPEIDRGPLRKIMLESLQPGTVIWDSQFVTMSSDGEGWQLVFQNGHTAYADIVIASDGANSKIRPFLTPIRPFYSGVTMVEGVVYDSATVAPTLHQLVNGGKIFAMGDEKTLIFSAKGDGSLVFYTGVKTDEHWYRDNGIDFSDKAQVLAWFKDTYAGWDASWLEIFDQGLPKFIVRPQYCMPLDQQWEAQSNLTMLGDAAHLMPPFAGEGVNMAMLDALELSEWLTSETVSDLRSAIAGYEQQMRTRASAIAKMTMEQTEALHSAGAIDHMVSMFRQSDSPNN